MTLDSCDGDGFGLAKLTVAEEAPAAAVAGTKAGQIVTLAPTQWPEGHYLHVVVWQKSGGTLPRFLFHFSSHRSVCLDLISGSRFFYAA